MPKKKPAPKAPAANALEMAARPAKYVNVNTRLEGRGKDDTQLCADISVRGFHVDQAELDHILGTKAHGALFVAANGKGKPAEPMFRNIDPLVVWDEFDGCDAKFSLGLSDTVVEFEENRLIAWRHFNGHRWRWQLTPLDGDTTEVTETFDWSTARLPLLLDLSPIPRRNRSSMDRSLDRLSGLFSASA
jgi:hypothetical protein